MAYKRFNATHSRADFSESWDFDNEREMVTSTKYFFFNGLRNYLLCRGEHSYLDMDVKIDEERYAILERLSKFSGDERTRKMRQLVGFAPSYNWETNFDWESAAKLAER